VPEIMIFLKPGGPTQELCGPLEGRGPTVEKHWTIGDPQNTVFGPICNNHGDHSNHNTSFGDLK